MKSLWHKIMMATGAGLAGAVVALAATQMLFTRPQPAFVTADLAGIATAKTLALASRDLEPKALEDASRQWAGKFQTLLHDVARENNIIILPRGLGIYGAPDITAELRQMMEVRP